jgi:flavorubredoxin
MHIYSSIPITDRVHWVGAIDWNLREMHGYETPRGTTYNAFLILGERITLIDTVKHGRHDELLARIASVIDPQRIDTVVSLHAEMDHSGGLPELLAAVRPRRVFTSKNGRQTLQDYFGLGDGITVVADGEVLDLGGLHLQCLYTPMLHWPDSMIAYLPEEAVLFSQDAFGMHLASAERFADELPHDILEYEATKYFANIILPYASLVPRLHRRLTDLGCSPAIIAPDHGPVWRGPEHWILARYLEWSRQASHPRAIVLYESMWGATERMAQALAEGVQAAGCQIDLMRLDANHQSHIATELLHAGALAVGSPTLNGEIFPSIAGCLTYLRGLKRKHLLGTAFGAYGWSPNAVRSLDAYLEGMGIQRVGEAIGVRYWPSADDLAQLHARGRQLGEELRRQPAIAAEG